MMTDLADLEKEPEEVVVAEEATVAVLEAAVV